MNLRKTSCILFAVAMVLSSCTPVAQQQQYEAAAARVQRSVDNMKESLSKATSAKVRVMMTGTVREEEFAVPSDEFAAMKDILARTAIVPPALDSEGEPQPQQRYFIELVFVGEDGTELSGIALTEAPWMKESEARKLKPTLTRDCRVPEWYLPDEDYDALKALPTIPAARVWADAQ